MSTEHDLYVVEARAGVLPHDFNKWDMANEDGWTVAHWAALCGFPVNFDQWDLADKNGRTVAHVAALYETLPVNFDQWGLTTNRVPSVLSYLLISSHRDEYIARWHTEKPLCRTVTDWEVFKIELPEIYSKYAVVESFDEVDIVMGTRLL
jgi:hypothetical protein